MQYVQTCTEGIKPGSLEKQPRTFTNLGSTRDKPRNGDLGVSISQLPLGPFHRVPQFSSGKWFWRLRFVWEGRAETRAGAKKETYWA